MLRNYLHLYSKVCFHSENLLQNLDNNISSKIFLWKFIKQINLYNGYYFTQLKTMYLPTMFIIQVNIT